MRAVDRTQFESAMLQFLRAELETGMTFASLARDSRTEEKRDRNLVNARKAYDTAKHFLEEHAPEEVAARSDLLDRLTKLRSELVELGTKFEGEASSS
jgi:hypothetical protein